MKSLMGNFIGATLLVAQSLILSVSAAEVIFGSVAFVRTGERLPLAQADGSIVTLTSLGAQQAHDAGTSFRERYLSSSNSTTGSSTTLYGLATNNVDPNQLYIQSDDAQYSVATSEAFMQALYPPYSSNSSTIQSNMLANGDYLPNPLDGYQYTWKHVPSDNDPSSVYTDGGAECQSFYDQASDTMSSDAIAALTQQTKPIYQLAGTVFASDEIPFAYFNFSNAYLIYDYLNYLNNHDEDAHELLTNNTKLSQSVFENIRYLADQYSWLLYGSTKPYAEAQSHQIGTVAGQTYAYAVLNRLQNSIATQGSIDKLSLFFAEASPMVSFFALSGLGDKGPDFQGLPKFGSSMAFELFQSVDSSPSANNASILYPDESSLRVRFIFRNGTEGDFSSYGLFGSTGDSMSWTDFQSKMSAISIPETGEWCRVCNSWDTTPFCLAYNSSAWQGVEDAKSNSDFGPHMSPKIAGLVGAVVTLAVVLLLLFVAVGCGGLRFQRAVPGQGEDQSRNLGGLKGAQRLGSDSDLTAIRRESKGAGISVGEQDLGSDGQVRPGSWEMAGGFAHRANAGRREEEADDRWTSLQRPVRAAERV